MNTSEAFENLWNEHGEYFDENKELAYKFFKLGRNKGIVVAAELAADLTDEILKLKGE